MDEQKPIDEAKQPITEELAERNERMKAEKAASVNEENKQTKQIIKIITASMNENDSHSKTDKMSSTDSDNGTSSIVFAFKPPLRTQFDI